MLIYEVNIDVDCAIREEYLAWLRPHMDEICALEGFLDAECFEVRDPAPAADRVSFCVQYRLADTATLEIYLREHAPRLRADGVARFGGRFSAHRRVIESLQPG